MSEELKRKKSDYLLELALEEQLEQDPMLKKYENEEAQHSPHQFSEAHCKRMEELFKAAENREKRRGQRKHRGKIAAGLALGLGLSAVAVLQTEAFRLPVLQFIADVQEEYTYLGIKDEYKSVTKRYALYEPSYIPDGFSIAKVHEGKRNFDIQYWNEEKNQVYTYSFSENITDIAIDTENIISSEIEIKGHRVWLMQKEDHVRLLMHINGHRIIIEGNISVETAEEILESVIID